jgi:hypothetical protein
MVWDKAHTTNGCVVLPHMRDTAVCKGVFDHLTDLLHLAACHRPHLHLMVASSTEHGVVVLHQRTFSVVRSCGQACASRCTVVDTSQLSTGASCEICD